MTRPKFPGKPSKITNRKRVNVTEQLASRVNDCEKVAEEICYKLAAFRKEFGDEDEQDTQTFQGFTQYDLKEALKKVKLKHIEMGHLGQEKWQFFQRELRYPFEDEYVSQSHKNGSLVRAGRRGKNFWKCRYEPPNKKCGSSDNISLQNNTPSTVKVFCRGENRRAGFRRNSQTFSSDSLKRTVAKKLLFKAKTSQREVSQEKSVRKFILPTRSVHSSRVIIPNKRFLHYDSGIGLSGQETNKKPKLLRTSGDASVSQHTNNSEVSTEDAVNWGGAHTDDPSSCRRTYRNGTDIGQGKSSLPKGPNSVPTNSEQNSMMETIARYTNSITGGKTNPVGRPRKFVKRPGQPNNSVPHVPLKSWMSKEEVRAKDKIERILKSQWDGRLQQHQSIESSPVLSKNKVNIVRQATLDLNKLSGTLFSQRAVNFNNAPVAGSAEDRLAGENKKSITCGVCGAVRYYTQGKHTHKFKVESCETCRKLISRCITAVKGGSVGLKVPLACLKGTGKCIVSPTNSNIQDSSSSADEDPFCRACRLKLCLQTYSIPKGLRKKVAQFLPQDMYDEVIGSTIKVNVQKRKFKVKPKEDECAVAVDLPSFSGNPDDEYHDVILQTLPHGWLKKIVWRNNSEKHWDLFLVSPDGRRFSARSEVMDYLRDSKIPYCDSYHNFLMPSYLDKMMSNQGVEDVCFNGLLKEFGKFNRMAKDGKNDSANATARHTKIRAAQRLKKRATKQYAKIRDSLNKQGCSEQLNSSNPKKVRKLGRRSGVVKKVGRLKHSTKRKKCQRLKLKGPRVKHVCRSASVVLGQPRATFPSTWSKGKTGGAGNKGDPSSCKQCKSGGGGRQRVLRESSAKSKQLRNEAEKGARELHCKPKLNKTDSIQRHVTQNNDLLGVRRLKGKPPDDAVDSDARNEKKLLSETSFKDSKQGPATLLDILKRETYNGVPSSGQNISNHINAFPFHTLDDKEHRLICVDFWESYDPEEVCKTGFGVIGSEPIPVKALCFLCGSAGQEKLIHCAACCESYHNFCIEDTLKDAEYSLSHETNAGKEQTWICPKCTLCHHCGKGAGQQLRCHRCHRTYHTECLGGDKVNRGKGSDYSWVCSSCFRCRSCGKAEVSVFVGNLTFCKACFRLRQKGNYCPLCQSCYEDDDYDTKMMECGKCKCWVHAKCEGLSDEKYQVLSFLPESVEFICRSCCVSPPAAWWLAVEAEMKGGYLAVLKTLGKHQKARCLVRRGQRKGDAQEDATRKSENEVGSRTLVSSDPCLDQPKVCHPPHGSDSELVCDSKLERSDESCDKLKHLREKYNIKDCRVVMKNCENKHVSSKEKDQSEHLCSKNHKNNQTDVVSGNSISCDDEPLVPSEPPSVVSDASVHSECCDASGYPSLNKYYLNMERENKRPNSLLSIKRKVNADEYNSLLEFHHDVQHLINACRDDDEINELICVYQQSLQEVFPWFDAEHARVFNCWFEGSVCKPPHDDHFYAMADGLVESEKQIQKSTQSACAEPVYIPNDYGSYVDENVKDTRFCAFCKCVGDGLPSQTGRLIYCGQNEWVHVNCALWSAEVFEEIDGSLQNVHSAVSRGRQIRCSECREKGASIGCCSRSCPETYHFSCAQQADCVFMEDKRVFCSSHAREVSGKPVNDDFSINRAIYVELDRKKKKFTEIPKVRFMVGSLIVESIGEMVMECDDPDTIVSVKFEASRLFWSCLQPWKIVKYYFRTSVFLPKPSPVEEGIHLTVDHTLDKNVVSRKLNEMSRWHRQLSMKEDAKEENICSPLTSVPQESRDNSPLREQDIFSTKIIVMNGDLSGDLQSNDNLLASDIKESLFSEVPTEVLDDVSMQDILDTLFDSEEIISESTLPQQSQPIGDLNPKKDDNAVETWGNKIVDVGKSRLTREPQHNFLSRETNAEACFGNQEYLDVSLRTGDASHVEKSYNIVKDSSVNKFSASCTDVDLKTCFRSENICKSNVVMPISNPSDMPSKLDGSESSKHVGKLKLSRGSKCKLEDDSTVYRDINFNPNSLHTLQELLWADDIPVTITKIGTADNKEKWNSVDQLRPKAISDDLSHFNDYSSRKKWNNGHTEHKEKGKENKKLLWNGASGFGISSCRIVQVDGTVDSSSTESEGSPKHCYDDDDDDSFPVSNLAERIKVQSLARSEPCNEGPVKCNKCHRTYRTKESFDKHISNCNNFEFYISSDTDSISSEEECSEKMKEMNSTKCPQSKPAASQNVAVNKSLPKVNRKLSSTTTSQPSTKSQERNGRKYRRIDASKKVDANSGAKNENIQSKPLFQSNTPTIVMQQVQSPNLVPAFMETFQQQTGHSLQYIATVEPQQLIPSFQLQPLQVVPGIGITSTQTQTLVIQQAPTIPCGIVAPDQLVLNPPSTFGVCGETNMQNGLYMPCGNSQPLYYRVDDVISSSRVISVVSDVGGISRVQPQIGHYETKVSSTSFSSAGNMRMQQENVQCSWTNGMQPLTVPVQNQCTITEVVPAPVCNVSITECPAEEVKHISNNSRSGCVQNNVSLNAGSKDIRKENSKTVANSVAKFVEERKVPQTVKENKCKAESIVANEKENDCSVRFDRLQKGDVPKINSVPFVNNLKSQKKVCDISSEKPIDSSPVHALKIRTKDNDKVEKETNVVVVPLVSNDVSLDVVSEQEVEVKGIGTEKKEKVVNRSIKSSNSTAKNNNIMYEVYSQEGFSCKSSSISEVWQKVFEAVQDARTSHNMTPLPLNPFGVSGLQMLGLKNNGLKFILEQLPGVRKCFKYKPRYHKPEGKLYDSIVSENKSGCARTEPFHSRAPYDMFSWLASRHRRPPQLTPPQDGEAMGNRRATSLDLPMAMRFRHLKETAKEAVGVYRSHIHGRGLFCLRDIDSGEMVIEYAGEVIRTTLTDKREKYYESKGIGCYMFRIDDQIVVDATMRGNAARFINHSCDPNCYSRVVDILGKKHILIFALRRILQGEELTYDYKFPIEDVKIPCTCGSRKCRKYLN